LAELQPEKREVDKMRNYRSVRHSGEVLNWSHNSGLSLIGAMGLSVSCGVKILIRMTADLYDFGNI
jgi:hypothetical protein